MVWGDAEDGDLGMSDRSRWSHGRCCRGACCRKGVVGASTAPLQPCRTGPTERPEFFHRERPELIPSYWSEVEGSDDRLAAPSNPQGPPPRIFVRSRESRSPGVCRQGLPPPDTFIDPGGVSIIGRSSSPDPSSGHAAALISPGSLPRRSARVLATCRRVRGNGNWVRGSVPALRSPGSATVRPGTGAGVRSDCRRSS